MNSSTISSLERLTYITELLYDRKESYSVNDIAECLNTPSAIIRHDLEAIALSREFRMDFYSDDPKFDMYEDVSEMVKDLRTGALDNMEFNLCQTDSWDDDDFFHTIPLSIAEYHALENFAPEIVTKSSFPLFKKKTITSPLGKSIKEYRSILSEAIVQHRTMQISYRANTGEDFQKAILPVALSHNVLDNLVYVISYENDTYQVYRLDRIKHMRQALHQLPYPTDLRILENLDYVWGMDYKFQPEIKPSKVRLLIEDTGNVLYKVRRDTATRKHGHLFQENGQWIYEDLVIGLNSFRSWIFSYGSSVLVLEPKELQENVLESYLKRSRSFSR